MRNLARLGVTVLLSGLAGCVLPPPLPPPPPPLVALPGPGRTQAQFQADDAGCRTVADAAPPSGATITVPAPYQAAPSGTAPSSAAAQTQAPAPQQTVQVTPGMVYLRCMTDHGNVVQPLAPVHPLYYGFYPAYPVYYGFGDTYPWLYGDYGFGFYGGFRGGYGGFGYRDGFRGGYGGGGFRGGYGGGRR